MDATTGGKVESSPAVAGGRVVVGSQDGRVYALDQTTGARLWRRNLGGPVQSSPALSGAAVYVGANENLYKLDAATGTIRWTDTMNSGGETPFTVTGSAAVGGGDVELFSEGHINLPAPQPDVSLNKIVEVAAGSGAYVSFGATGVSPEAPFTSPFAPSEPLANGVVCAPGPTFRDILCDSPGGFVGNEGAVPTAASIVSSYALANGMVFVADTGGTVYAASV